VFNLHGIASKIRESFNFQEKNVEHNLQLSFISLAHRFDYFHPLINLDEFMVKDFENEILFSTGN